MVLFRCCGKTCNLPCSSTPGAAVLIAMTGSQSSPLRTRASLQHCLCFLSNHIVAVLCCIYTTGAACCALMQMQRNLPTLFQLCSGHTCGMCYIM